MASSTNIQHITSTNTSELSNSQHMSKLQELTGETFDRLNNSGLSWWHFKAVLIAGSGFLCDGYNVNVIGLVTDQISRIYYPDWTYWSPEQCTSYSQGLYSKNIPPVTVTSAGAATNCGSNYSKISSYTYPDYHILGAIPTSVSFALSAVLLCGLITGQLLFGVLGDRLGRKKMFVVTVLGMIAFAILSGVTFGTGTVATIASINVFRFILGVFLGGEYPLSGVLISEFSNTKNRGLLVLLVFSCQGLGYMASEAAVAMFAAIWQATNADPDYLWRVCLVFGAVPAIAAVYARTQMPETPRYRLFNELNTQGMLTDMEAVFEREGVLTEDARTVLAHELNVSSNIRANRSQVQSWSWFIRNYGIILFGTAMSWFMQDVAFYSKVLFGLSNVIGPPLNLISANNYTMSGATYMLKNTAIEAYINLASIYPGYFAAALVVDYKWMGRWRLQMLGFVVMLVVSAILAGMYERLKTQIAPFFVLYALNGFFNNFGPNTTTYLYPSEVFPSEWRTTGHGISSAAGKTGAVVGTFGFHYMAAAPGIGYNGAFGLLAGTAFLGVLVTFLLPETTGKTLEALGQDSYVLNTISPEQDGIEHLEKMGTNNYYEATKNHSSQDIATGASPQLNEDISYV